MTMTYAEACEHFGVREWGHYGAPLAVRLLRGAKPVDGCWRRNSRNMSGYSVVDVRGTSKAAHRAMYELMVGPIAHGLDLDHLCHTSDCHLGKDCPHRRCINPAHLEPVTERTNVLRGNGVAAVNASKTHCKRGHEFTPENTYVWSKPSRPYRACRKCIQLHVQNYRARKSAA